MEHTNEELIKEAIKRLDIIDEVLEQCQISLTAVSVEKQIARYLLWLGFEKENKPLAQ